MRLQSIFLCVIGAAAWKIPQGIPDGVYEVHNNDGGTLNFTLLNTAASTQGLIASREVEQRSLSLPETTTCIFYSLNANDNNNAFNALADSCTDGLSKPRGAFAVSRDVVVYWCNYSNLPSCIAADASFSIQQFQSMVCGSFIAGFIQWSGQAYGYYLFPY